MIQSQINPVNQQRELDNNFELLKAKSLFEILNRKKQQNNEEEERINEELEEEVEIMELFHFKNGYAFHGLIKGDKIVDGVKGHIINPDNERIAVKYKFIDEVDAGSFKT